MAQDYILRSFKKGDYQDAHGNYWCTAALEGIGEPVKWVVKSPQSIQEGQTYYGEVKELTSKAGKSYLRFYKQQKADGEPNVNNTADKRSSNYKDNSDGMRQGMCFNNATLFVNMMVAEEKSKPSPEEWAQLVFAHAQALYLMGDLKASQNTETPVDKVFPVKEEQPINLDYIPF